MIGTMVRAFQLLIASVPPQGRGKCVQGSWRDTAQWQRDEQAVVVVGRGLGGLETRGRVELSQDKRDVSRRYVPRAISRRCAPKSCAKGLGNHSRPRYRSRNYAV